MRFDYARYDGLGLAALVRSREISPAELAEQAIAAIELINPQLNFVSHELFDRAREAALHIDPLAPFAGVPFLLKDLGAQLAGTPLVGGSRLMRGNVSAIDTTLTTRFLKAGVNILAKSTTPELGAQLTTESVLSGVTRNPWHYEKTPGGSSGGAAAAVAAGVVPVAHANDGLGSIRIPASNCGLFGLKPTRQRTPCGPEIAEVSGGRGVEFIVSRSVRDSAALLDAVHGADVGAPHWAPPPTRSYLSEVGAVGRSLKVAVMTTTFTGKRVHPACERAVRDTAALCDRLGHDIVDDMPNVEWSAYLHAVRTAGTASLAAGLQELGEKMGRVPSPDNLEPLTWLSFLEGQTISGREYIRAIDTYARLQRAMGAFFLNYDILLTPMLSTPPCDIGFLGAPADDLDGFWEKFAGDSYSPFAGIFNVTGHPAASVPLHMSDGLPIGTQIVARFGEEGNIFRLAGQFEAAQPWAYRRPPLHVLCA